jgi:hypothetical protein
MNRSWLRQCPNCLKLRYAHFVWLCYTVSFCSVCESTRAYKINVAAKRHRRTGRQTSPLYATWISAPYHRHRMCNAHVTNTQISYIKWQSWIVPWNANAQDTLQRGRFMWKQSGPVAQIYAKLTSKTLQNIWFIRGSFIFQIHLFVCSSWSLCGSQLILHSLHFP